jgi:2-polyprenyl-3-methyl-5-hydroxy-6-metoxy-1,4-benzoquinol methylase
MAGNKSELGLWEEVMSTVPDDTITLGSYFAHQLLYNPRHILFTFSRYKFAARLLGETKKRRVLELGCNEGLGTLLLAQAATEVVAVDFDENSITRAIANFGDGNIDFQCSNFLDKKYGSFDTIVSIDVIEHIRAEDEQKYLETIYQNLNKHSFCIIGTPNITAREYASRESQIGHVNLYSAERLRDTFKKIFYRVFLFGMNDEVVHTGYYPMCHYIFLLGVGKKPGCLTCS